MVFHGRVSFNHKSNNGIRTIGWGPARFDTKWSNAGSGSIHVYINLPSVVEIAPAADLRDFSQIRDAARFDFTSSSHTLEEGEILIVKNENDFYAAIKIVRVKARSHSDQVDETTFEYIILEAGDRNFSMCNAPPVIDETFSKRVLFLGAGFSKNWGGLLAREVGDFLLGHRAVQDRPALVRLLAREPSFEDALERTRTGEFEAEDEAALQRGIKDAFEQMDRAYKIPNGPVLNYTADEFITRFCMRPHATGYVFTLNQDLLLERVHGHLSNRPKLVIPGVSWAPTGGSMFPADAGNIPLASPAYRNGFEPSLLRNFNLIKLHGSINWRSGADSSIVMGRRKRQAISNIPLLEWYHRVFRSVLSSGDVRLMVIGYSWTDEHINEVIAHAVRDYGLRVYSWNPMPLRDALVTNPDRELILDSMCGATTASLAEVMPQTPMSPGSPTLDGIIESFF